jgi:hypothetical protein
MSRKGPRARKNVPYLLALSGDEGCRARATLADRDRARISALSDVERIPNPAHAAPSDAAPFLHRGCCDARRTITSAMPGGRELHKTD